VLFVAIGVRADIPHVDVVPVSYENIYNIMNLNLTCGDNELIRYNLVTSSWECSSESTASRYATNGTYLLNTTSDIWINETMLNETIIALEENDTRLNANGTWLIDDNTNIWFDDIRLNATYYYSEANLTNLLDDNYINAYANGTYLVNDTTNIWLNETMLNLTIDARAGYLNSNDTYLIEDNTNLWVNVSKFNENYVELTGDIMTGNLDMDNNNITNIDHLEVNGNTNMNDLIMDVSARIRGFGSSGVKFSDDVYPYSTGNYDLGNATLLWRGIYAEHFYGDGSGLTNINASSVTDNWVNESGDTMTGNLTTSEWFNGRFNWTTTDEWSSFDGSVFDFNESMLSTAYYDAVSMNIVAGTLDGGSLSNTTHSEGSYDGVTMNISEASGSPGLDVRINFTDGETFNLLLMRYKTSALSGDYPILQLWNYNTLEWDDYPIIGTTTDFRIIDRTVFYPSSHISGGLVQLRLYKTSNGNTNNHYYIDWLAIATGYGTPAGYEIDPLAIHRDGTTPLTANWDAGSYNITADWGFMKINWSDIQNKFITAVDNIYIYMSGTTVTLNETKLNATIDARAAGGAQLNSNDTYLIEDNTNLWVNVSKFNSLYYYSKTNLTNLLNDNYYYSPSNITDNTYTGNFTTTGNITAAYFHGDGSQLTGIVSGLWTNVSGVATYDGDTNVTGTMYANNFSSNSPLRLQTGGTTRLFINDTTGNIGIGDEDPQSKLTVAGNINTTGNISIQNSQRIYFGNNSDAYIEWDNVNNKLIIKVT